MCFLPVEFQNTIGMMPTLPTASGAHVKGVCYLLLYAAGCLTSLLFVIAPHKYKSQQQLQINSRHARATKNT